MTMPMTVSTSAGSYDVLVGAAALHELPLRLATLGLRGTLWLIADSGCFPFYGQPLIEMLQQAGFSVQSYVVPAGEESKSQQQLWALYDWMLAGNIERRDCVLALGGGVVGDLAGFAAASVLRGVAFIQLPTTLLAMVDAAIGGKTGINHPLGKNLIGAFHPPRLVLADTLTLRTLPPRELRAGWAEVIKHGVIRDTVLFEQLEAAAATQPFDPLLPEPLLGDLIRRAAAVKVGVVSRDERESGERMLLNYGHTIGHALEALLGYGTLLHGEAVAIGMRVAGTLACRLGMFSPADLARQHSLLQRFGLPVELPTDLDQAALLAHTLRDKKVQARRIRWVLPDAIGNAVTRDDLPAELLETVLTELQRSAEKY